MTIRSVCNWFDQPASMRRSSENDDKSAAIHFDEELPARSVAICGGWPTRPQIVDCSVPIWPQEFGA
jgi:hypothetical protein